VQTVARRHCPTYPFFNTQGRFCDYSPGLDNGRVGRLRTQIHYPQSSDSSPRLIATSGVCVGEVAALVAAQVGGPQAAFNRHGLPGAETGWLAGAVVSRPARGADAEQGIGFKSLTEQIDTTTPGGKLIFHVFGALAEFERDLIRERTQAGLAAARVRGRLGGRPKKLAAPKQRELARTLYEGGQTDIATICQTLGISRATLYRALKDSA
jgi:hypothetical protein